MPTAIQIERLVKVYRGSEKAVVNGLQLCVEEGEIYGFLGPNGAGKTTTINILCGLLPFNDGCVSVFGYRLPQQISKIKPLIGVVPQDIALYPTLTARENLMIFGGMYGIPRKELNQKINNWLHELGLSQHQHRQIGDYSGGMKRRVNLIAGILHQPKLVILDEPTVGADVQSKAVLIDTLKKINREGTTILYTSHYMEEAESLCSRVGIVDNGKIIAEGSPEELMNAHNGINDLENVYLALTGKKLRD
jgi:ABC-2 type transport system ATP-binding protein